MTDPDDRPHEPSSVVPSRAGRTRFQFGLRVVFWLVAAVAVWMTVYINREESARLARQIERLRPLAPELVVDDLEKPVLVKFDELWFDENRWGLYLPPGRYRICLATRGVDVKGFPSSFASTTIGPGRHFLALEQSEAKPGWRFGVIGDGARLLSVDETPNWAGTGWSSGGVSPMGEDWPIVLIRRRNIRSDAGGRSTPPQGPTEGLLLWIERTAGPDPSKSK